jgi:hypothetical protein
MRGSGQAFRAGQGGGTERGFQPVNGAAMDRSTWGAACGGGQTLEAGDVRVRRSQAELRGERRLLARSNYRPVRQPPGGHHRASTKKPMARMGHSPMRAALIYQHAARERDDKIAAGISATDRGSADKSSCRGLPRSERAQQRCLTTWRSNLYRRSAHLWS